MREPSDTLTDKQVTGSGLPEAFAERKMRTSSAANLGANLRNSVKRNSPVHTKFGRQPSL